MGADGDIVHALHNIHGTGKRISRSDISQDRIGGTWVHVRFRHLWDTDSSGIGPTGDHAGRENARNAILISIIQLGHQLIIESVSETDKITNALRKAGLK